VFELKYSSIIKNWLAYLLFCCTCILISVCNDRVTDGSVEDHLKWVVLLRIS